MNDAGISASAIQGYIPHRPPMVWIDEVMRYAADGGECRVQVRANALYMSASGLRASSCLEFIAQAYGFIWICHITRNVDPHAKAMERAMLAAFKNARFDNSALREVKDGDTLTVDISGIRVMGPITAFHGEVLRQGTRLCEVQMRTFSA
jgi:predicted hotdog family 3-hydroxylacyl-ACP dehydratase